MARPYYSKCREIKDFYSEVGGWLNCVIVENIENYSDRYTLFPAST